MSTVTLIKSRYHSSKYIILSAFSVLISKSTTVVHFVNLFLNLEQYIEVSIDDFHEIFKEDFSLDVRVSTVNVSVTCHIDSFSQWNKDFDLYSINQTFHFQFFSLLDGGLYTCQAETLSISLELIPTGGFLKIIARWWVIFRGLRNPQLVALCGLTHINSLWVGQACKLLIFFS